MRIVIGILAAVGVIALFATTFIGGAFFGLSKANNP